MKKLLVFMLVFMLSLCSAIVACGEDDGDNPSPPPPHVHTLKKVERIEPTLESEGVTSHYVCKDATCGEIFTDIDGKNKLNPSDIVIPKLLPPLTFEKLEIEYNFKFLPDEFNEGFYTEISFYDHFVKDTTNARSNIGPAFPTPYVFMKADNRGDFTFNFEIDEDGYYAFAIKIFCITPGYYRRVNFKIDGSDYVSLGYTHLEEDYGFVQYASGIEANMSAGTHSFTLSLYPDETTSLFLSGFIFEKLS